MKHTSSPDPWPFEDSKNVAVFTTSHVLRDQQPVLHVFHDEDDGAWQFHSQTPATSAEEMMVVALEEMVEYDPTLGELADLPYGWSASRAKAGGPWKRQKG